VSLRVLRGEISFSGRIGNRRNARISHSGKNGNRFYRKTRIPAETAIPLSSSNSVRLHYLHALRGQRITDCGKNGNRHPRDVRIAAKTATGTTAAARATTRESRQKRQPSVLPASRGAAHTAQRATFQARSGR